ncbi:primosomal protein DnaI [Shouchella clausii]|uniref:primosomal protein DnaI n=1 Tax=Shouchella clausii TaxID=79880 RepID=UPI000BA5ED7C|nr:primosomal protein DnaI [Shouchella clausii]PAE93483.1 primosomal protein DnaI [Shouchella clausii]
MESIEQALKAFDQDGRLQKRIERQRQELLDSAIVQAFLQDHPDVTRAMIDRALSKLYEFKKERGNCQTCPGLDHCPNMIKGFQPALYTERGSIEISYSRCQLKREQEAEQAKLQLIQSLYIPKDILKATFDDMEQNEERADALSEGLEFALSANPGEKGKGLYLYGKFGVGKTYLLGAIANELKTKNIQSYLIYTPDFFREMKQAIGDGSFQEKLEAVRKAPVLMLDDIGAETTTAWTRDEVLGPILQYRMAEKLPTLFTSNYDYDELEEQLAYSEKGGIERLKAKRIMERIKHFTTFVEVGGQNRRSM